jgi:hypothetical protein
MASGKGFPADVGLWALSVESAGHRFFNVIKDKKLMKNGGDAVGSVIKKRKKKMRKHKHKKLLARTRHQRRKK